MRFCKNIAVFCGSSRGAKPEYAAAARKLGRLLGSQGRGLVFGGCLDGLMAEVAAGARETGAPIHSQFIKGLYQEKDHIPGADECFYDNVSERKQGLLSHCDACVMLPGGFGTLDEFTDVCAAVQLGEVRRPLGILNTAGYFDPLLSFFAGMRKEGFLSPEWDGLYAAASDPESLLGMLDAAQSGNDQ